MIRIYIWHPKIKQRGSVGSSGIGWGHAAIEIVDNSYISKWPKRENTRYGYTMCYEEDVDVCGREADEVIEISSLDEKAMAEYWEEARQKEFDDIFHNCCRISAKALNHGFFWSNYNRGLGTFFSLFTRTYITNFGDTIIHEFGEFFNITTTWTPYSVSRLAKYIKKIVD